MLFRSYVVNGLDSGFSDTGMRSARNSLKTDNNDAKSVVGRLTISPSLGQEVGFSGYYGEFDGEDDVLSGVGFDSLFTFGPVELVSEFAHFEVEEMMTTARDLPSFLHGAYGQINYHFWPEFLDDTFLGRDFDDPTLTLVEIGRAHV